MNRALRTQAADKHHSTEKAEGEGEGRDRVLTAADELALRASSLKDPRLSGALAAYYAARTGG